MKHLKLFESYNDEEDYDKMAWTKYFEVLSIKYSVGGDDFRLITPEHPEFNDCIQDCVESEWKDDEIEIYSIRRKEDGEIFTLGQPVFNVSLDIKNFGIADKFWPSFSQMRVEIGRGGFPLNHKFFMSSTILDLKNKGINRYYATDINESKEVDPSEWFDLIKKYPSALPSNREFEEIKKVAQFYIDDIEFDKPNIANTRSITISPKNNNIVIWKHEDEYWSVTTTNNRTGQTFWICDGIDELFELIKVILEK